VPPPTERARSGPDHRQRPHPAGDVRPRGPDGLALVHERLLGPFGDHRRARPADLLAAYAGRGLATAVTPQLGNPDQAVARPHPDVLFALRLTDTPQQHEPTRQPIAPTTVGGLWQGSALRPVGLGRCRDVRRSLRAGEELVVLRDRRRSDRAARQ
jgi:hypothetical protein